MIELIRMKMRLKRNYNNTDLDLGVFYHFKL